MAQTVHGEFALGRGVEVRSLAKRFALNGRLQIADFLAEDSAEALRAHLCETDRWRRLFNAGERSYEMGTAEWEALGEDKRNEIREVINEAAAFDFQYQYETIRVPDLPTHRTSSGTILDRFAEFMSSPAVLHVIAEITSISDIVYADCQATRYRPDDFLTPHSDEREGMHRRLAYVLSTTRDWLPRWGGLLHFVDSRGGVEETITPRFNALSLFAIGQSHYVSQVATFAPVARISVTGWLRAQIPD